MRFATLTSILRGLRPRSPKETVSTVELDSRTRCWEKFPLDWSAFSLASVAADMPHAIVDGPFGSSLKTEHYREKGVPVIQSGFVASGEFQADSYVYVDQGLVEA